MGEAVGCPHTEDAIALVMARWPKEEKELVARAAAFLFERIPAGAELVCPIKRELAIVERDGRRRSELVGFLVVARPIIVTQFVIEALARPSEGAPK